MTARSVLGIIPARGGSKGIPQKNLAMLGGETLLARACASALASGALTAMIVSTDDEKIAAEARRCGVEVPALRPATLATDDTPMLDVLRHELHAYRQRTGASPDAVMVLQPTSPFRTAARIDEAIALLTSSNADTVVGVREVPHAFLPQKLMRMENGRLVFMDPSIPRRQDAPLLYARNGPAILLTKAAVIDGGSLYGKDIRPLIMNMKESLDIDTQEDIDLAAALLALPTHGA